MNSMPDTMNTQVLEGVRYLVLRKLLNVVGVAVFVAGAASLRAHIGQSAHHQLVDQVGSLVCDEMCDRVKS